MSWLVGALSKLGAVMKSAPAKTTLGGLAGFGTVYNILADLQRQKLQRRAAALAERYATMTPQQIAAEVRALARPLSAGLTADVGNLVQARMAERGLAQAPGIFAEEEMQALAPFMEQEYNRATQLFLQKMGIPAQYLQTAAGLTAQPQDLSALWQLLFPIRTSPKRGGMTTSDWARLALTSLGPRRSTALSGFVEPAGGELPWWADWSIPKWATTPR